MYVFWALFPILTTARDFEMVDWRSLRIDEFKHTDQIVSEDFTSIHASELRMAVHWELLKEAIRVALVYWLNNSIGKQLTSMGRMNIPDVVFEDKVKCTNGTLYLLPSTLRFGPPYVMTNPKMTTYVFTEIGAVRYEYSQCEGEQIKGGLNGTLKSNRIYWQMTHYGKYHPTPCQTVFNRFKLWSGNFTWGSTDVDISTFQFNDTQGIQGLQRYVFQTLVPQYQRIIENKMKQKLIPRIFPYKDSRGSPPSHVCSKFLDF